MKYRPEIDGMRAVAVLPVILFHAGFEGFAGGFVGVDVFFVISGYLITSILLEGLEQNRFSILQFYERRARRILPALFFVMLACLPFAWMWMQPTQLQDFAHSVMAVVFFVSNILFWREAGYFDSAAEEKPLLHTWSLAVEEQFYIFFPLLLLMLWRFGRAPVFYSILILSILSLLLSEWGWRTSPMANFYLIPTRAWELGAGSICACMIRYQSVKGVFAKPATQQALSLLGLGLVALSVFAFDKTTPFPSLYALVPVGGTALVILFAQSHTWVARGLSMRGVIGIGLISYSAYLWHQPLFAFARIRLADAPPDWLMLCLSVASLALAAFSWRFVEQPFRRQPVPVLATRRSVFTASLLTGAAFGLVALALTSQNGFPARTSADGRMLAEIENDFLLEGLASDCGDLQLSACRTSATPETVLWGDSFAMQLVPALLAQPDPVAFIQYTKGACNPVFGVAQGQFNGGPNWPAACMAFNARLLLLLEQTPSVRHVILSSPFHNLFSAAPIASTGPISQDDALAFVTQRFSETLDAVQALGIDVTIVAPPPTDGSALGRCASKRLHFGGDLAACDFSPADFDQAYKQAVSFLSRFEDRVHVVWPEDLICRDGQCAASYEGRPLYSRGGHLSEHGSVFIAPLLARPE